MLPPYQRIPYRAIPALARNVLNKTVGIENYLHPLGLFQLMKVHLVDFIKPLLIERTRFPQVVKAFLHPFGIVTIEDVLQFLKPALTLVESKHLKQMHLQWVEYCCCHNPNIFNLWVQRYE